MKAKKKANSKTIISQLQSHSPSDLRRYNIILESIIQSIKQEDVNQKTDNGMTPLHLCCMTGNTRLVNLLLAEGASSKIKDNFGCTARYYTILYGYYKTLEEFIKLVDVTTYKSYVSNIEDEYFSVLIEASRINKQKG